MDVRGDVDEGACDGDDGHAAFERAVVVGPDRGGDDGAEGGAADAAGNGDSSGGEVEPGDAPPGEGRREREGGVGAGGEHRSEGGLVGRGRRPDESEDIGGELTPLAAVDAGAQDVPRDPECAGLGASDEPGLVGRELAECVQRLVHGHQFSEGV